ncbi:hypothetical protein [Acaryochloris sp. IP29b_bin.148]|uniref:hypothetical protein n=1 Tax=Acaryochloris sp. IP29b_bin.148 TaxID=2969218 RepID=UPI0026328FAB|nr:hypothetical protein [Acaryochloris sp. IP29b_bin.148]
MTQQNPSEQNSTEQDATSTAPQTASTNGCLGCLAVVFGVPIALMAVSYIFSAIGFFEPSSTKYSSNNFDLPRSVPKVDQNKCKAVEDAVICDYSRGGVWCVTGGGVADGTDLFRLKDFGDPIPLASNSIFVPNGKCMAAKGVLNVRGKTAIIFEEGGERRLAWSQYLEHDS